MFNKKAKYEYELIDEYEAGIMLNGPEVKAMREDKMAFNDSYCVIQSGELFLKKFHISVKDAKEEMTLRDRKLLLNKKEIKKIEKVIKEKGLTIVPTHIYFNKIGLVKVKISTAKGKKLYDKRESIKKRDLSIIQE